MKELEQLKTQLKEEKELTTTLEAQLLTAQEELSILKVKINQLPSWEKFIEVETERDEAKKEYYEIKEKLEQIVHEKQVLEVQFAELSANRLTSEEIKKDNQQLNKKLAQSQDRNKDLKKQVKELESEMLTEQIANNNILDKERKEKQAVKQELAEKQVEITNFEKKKKVSDKIIQQLKEELQDEREKNKEKEVKVTELEQELVKLQINEEQAQVEVLPKK